VNQHRVEKLVSASATILTLSVITISKMTTTTSEIQPLLERLVYKSRATEPMGTLELFNLLNQSRQKNARLGITGHLLYADGMFTQCIEGTTAAIEDLWLSLSKDPRHDAITIVDRSTVYERRFEEWSMAFSSYRYLNAFNMPGFFPLDVHGVSDKSRICSG
jgi:hypothetical protein